ncbi:MAG: hypothetical protein A2169_04660 [Deltaproteobacteria bacterium RBG_13_47_9]|nr:MAG: hypothetical protein A2169_04660 [Deltaproteobacteria bacterium RBG_13_47_9]
MLKQVQHDILTISPIMTQSHQEGGEFFRELDGPQLCCGVLHLMLQRFGIFEIKRARKNQSSKPFFEAFIETYS